MPMFVRALRGRPRYYTGHGAACGLSHHGVESVRALVRQADLDEGLPPWVSTAKSARSTEAGAAGEPELKCPKEIRNERRVSPGRVNRPHKE